MHRIKSISLMFMVLFLVACTTVRTDKSKYHTVNTHQQTTLENTKRIINKTDSSVKSLPAVRHLLNKAHAQQKDGNYNTAIVSLQRAIRIAPRYPESYFCLAEIRYKQGDYDQARSLAQKSLSLGAKGEIKNQSQYLIKLTSK